MRRASAFDLVAVVPIPRRHQRDAECQNRDASDDHNQDIARRNWRGPPILRRRCDRRCRSQHESHYAVWVADDPEHIVDAARDVSLSHGEVGLSVYRVEGDEDARELAIRYALTCRNGPADHMDYIVFPDEVAIE